MWVPVILSLAVDVRAVFHDTIAFETSIPAVLDGSRFFQQDKIAEPCVIITIDGLGSLDGDYSLLDNSPSPQGGKPSWIGTSADTQDLLLSWQPLEHMWAIGIRDTDLFHAFVRADNGSLPPTYSSWWQVFDPDLSAFKAADTTVAVRCPGEHGILR